MPTATLEEYLEAIYRLAKDGPVRPSAIAEAMDVSAPTVTATLRRLSERGLVSRPKGGVMLTDEGSLEALSILRRHRLAERLLVDVLGLPWEDVHEDACLLEHALSPRVQDALDRVLGHPATCPHGHPIPTADLDVHWVQTRPLSAVPAGARVAIESVRDTDGAALDDAKRLSLLPGVELLVAGVSADGGLQIEADGRRHAVPRDLASRIDVVDVV